MKFFLAVLFSVTVCFAAGREGLLNIQSAPDTLPQSVDQALNSIADWYGVDSLHMQSGETGNVTIATKWGAGLLCKDIYNNSGSVATIYFVTNHSSKVQLIKIAGYSHSGKLPPVITIIRTGTSDSLLLFFQK